MPGRVARTAASRATAMVGSEASSEERGWRARAACSTGPQRRRRRRPAQAPRAGRAGAPRAPPARCPASQPAQGCVVLPSSRNATRHLPDAGLGLWLHSRDREGQRSTGPGEAPRSGAAASPVCSSAPLGRVPAGQDVPRLRNQRHAAARPRTAVHHVSEDRASARWRRRLRDRPDSAQELRLPCALRPAYLTTYDDSVKCRGTPPGICFPAPRRRAWTRSCGRR